MSNHITIIDADEGNPQRGFCVRVGPKNGFNRTASCLRPGGVGSPTVYPDFAAAYNAAAEYKKRAAPNFIIRADCTL